MGPPEPFKALSTDPIRDAVISKALDLGFDMAGIAAPQSVTEAAVRFREFVGRGWHGDMDWLAEKASRRTDPEILWPQAKSILVVGMNYGSGSDPLEIIGQSENGAISVYAQGRDYHLVLKKRLKQLGRWIVDQFDCDIKVFVDTAPVLEKPLASAAGLGWQGKHTNLVSREFGSWLFLGSVFTTLDLVSDQAEDDHCGGCRACLDVCPAGAFPAPYQLDARRCISYLTIEHKGTIPVELRPAMGNRVFGCDDCLAVCPWNKYARLATETALLPRAGLTAPKLADLSRLDDRAFRALFSGSNIKRTGRDRFVRNVMIAIGNSGDRSLIAPAKERLDDVSPLVRAMAVWALGRLMTKSEFSALWEQIRANEQDPSVREEWDAVSGQWDSGG